MIGCGKISDLYLRTAQKFPILDITACADLNRQAAADRGREFRIRKILTTEQLLGDPEIDIVLNLTIPKAHAQITLAALNAGKHVYTEKPLGVTRVEGAAILEAAAKNKKLICGAPDTFLRIRPADGPAGDRRRGSRPPGGVHGVHDVSGA